MDILPFRPNDRDAWYPLWRGYQAFYQTDIPDETSAVTWRRVLDPAEPVFGALAWEGGAAVGLVHWLFHRTCWAVTDNCYLQDLFVAPGRRQSGIGKRLIEHVYSAARAAGSGRVYWHTQETNATARRLYDQVADLSGFIQYRKALD